MCGEGVSETIVFKLCCDIAGHWPNFLIIAKGMHGFQVRVVHFPNADGVG